MQPEGSLHCSEGPATGSYPELDESSSHSSKINIKFILTHEPRRPKWSVPFRFSD
jgi:hypothetical protein